MASGSRARDGHRMTREQFIDEYLQRSGIDASHKIPTGFRFGAREYLALPCACGADGCEGWATVLNTPEDIATHNLLFAPTIVEVPDA